MTYHGIQSIVTDIEGTTTSVSFVYDVLFPYAREHIAGFVRTHQDQVAVRSDIDAVRRESGQPGLDLEGVIQQLLTWIEQDQKITPLKSLQGMIWKAGYESGAFSGHVYADAYEQLKQWRQRGIALYVYSSGSVAAQKLLFGCSDFGDMTPLFSGYFDTQTGPKRDIGSYQVITRAIGHAPEQILFLSDVVEELDAARDAGMQTGWLVRDNANGEASALHPRLQDFGQISIA